MMKNELVLLFFFVMLIAVLWGIPKTRRMTGDWLVALKSVPLGCLATMILTVVFSSMFVILGWLFVIVFVVMGVGVVILATCAIKKYYKVEKKYSLIPFVVTAVLLILVYIGIMVALAAFYLFNPSSYRGDWRSYTVPSANGVEVIFQERSIHPFLAEYEYQIVFDDEQKKERKFLQTNTGGQTYFNIYSLNDGKLLFRDKDADYIVVPEKMEVYCIFFRNDRHYIAPLCEEKWSIWGVNEIEDKVYFDLNSKTYLAQEFIYDFKDKKYIGCITRGQFHTPLEIPETPISSLYNSFKIDDIRK